MSRLIPWRLSAIPAAACALALLAGAATGQPPAEKPPPATPAEQQLQALVQQLSADQFSQRELASEQLMKAGLPAVAVIERTLDRHNPESAARAVAILNHYALSSKAAVEIAASAALDRIAVGESPAARQARKQLAQLAERRERQAQQRLSKAGMVARLHSPTGFGTTVFSVEFNKSWAGTTDDLAQLRWLKNVQQVTITYPDADNSWMQHVAALPRLAYLSIKRTKIGDEGICQLKPEQPLQNLDLKYMDLTDEVVDHLKQIRTLSHVRLFGTKITLEGAESLRRKLAQANIDHRDGAFLGVSCTSHPQRLGCVITMVSDGTAAERIGIEVNDVVVEYAGHSVGDFETLTKWISRNQVGDEVRLLFARQVDVYEFVLDGVGGMKSGLEVKPHKLGIKVAKVMGESPLLTRVREGDVIYQIDDTRITSLKQLDDALMKLEKGVGATVFVARGGEIFERVAKLGEWE